MFCILIPKVLINDNPETSNSCERDPLFEPKSGDVWKTRDADYHVGEVRDLSIDMFMNGACICKNRISFRAFLRSLNAEFGGNSESEI